MGALQSPRELEGREKTHFVFFCRFPNYFGQERYHIKRACMWCKLHALSGGGARDISRQPGHTPLNAFRMADVMSRPPCETSSAPPTPSSASKSSLGRARSTLLYLSYDRKHSVFVRQKSGTSIEFEYSNDRSSPPALVLSRVHGMPPTISTYSWSASLYVPSS